MQCPRCNAIVKEGIKFCPACGGGLPSWTGRLKAGDVLAERYKVERPLARGGMGAVYLASDMRLGDAPVALKEMTLHHAPGDTETWQRAVEEFRREASLLARLSHPNLPHVIDQFEANGNQFLVMELIDGRTLRAELESRSAPVPLGEALDWFRQLASVLSYLHGQASPIIYRDLKPANIMLRPDGRVTLIDFGIARLYKPGQSGDTSVYGTPGYAPPEQYGLGQTDARSDVYSLAMVLHEVLTGHDPARRKNVRPALVHEARPDVPEHLGQALNRALALEPDERFASVNELAEAMRGPALVASPTKPG
ncbi:MAG TPA: protein kinase, partial [Herpetosiphonaceae bacterium]